MPRLRDGVIKRGGSWSYVIRVPDPATGVTKPKWVGGFATEEAAKAARERLASAPVAASRSKVHLTVADYLAEWVEAHASTVKPKTLAGYRHDIDHYIVPRIGRMRLQALRPAVISKFYRDLTEHGGRDGRTCQRRRSPTSTARCEGTRRCRRRRTTARRQSGGKIEAAEKQPSRTHPESGPPTSSARS